MRGRKVNKRSYWLYRIHHTMVIESFVMEQSMLLPHFRLAIALVTLNGFAKNEMFGFVTSIWPTFLTTTLLVIVFYPYKHIAQQTSNLNPEMKFELLSLTAHLQLLFPLQINANGFCQMSKQIQITQCWTLEGMVSNMCIIEILCIAVYKFSFSFQFDSFELKTHQRFLTFGLSDHLSFLSAGVE